MEEFYGAQERVELYEGRFRSPGSELWLDATQQHKIRKHFAGEILWRNGD